MKNTKRNPNIYKASNVAFDSNDLIATSYDWWVFVKKIQGKVVFNSYRYSVSTSKHQHKVRSLMRDLGFKIDIEVEVKESLFTHHDLKKLINESAKQIAERDLAKKNKIKAKRVYKKLLELGLYDADGTPINANIETKRITGQYAY